MLPESYDPRNASNAHGRQVHEAVDLLEQAARRLKKMRKLAAGSDQATEVDHLIAELRQTHRRRPRLQQEFDRAGLP